METVIGVLLIIMAVFLVIAVLMQSSKDHRHGGSVAGGAETFFGKNKGKTLDAMFNKLTTVVAIVFVLLVVVLYVIQPDGTTAPVETATPDVETEVEVETEDEVDPEASVEANPVEDGSDVAEENADDTVVEDNADAANADENGEAVEDVTPAE